MSTLKYYGNPVQSYVFKNKRCIYFGNKVWSRGVTTIIRKYFAPTYAFKKLKRVKYPRGLPKRSAIRRGHAIDRTLQCWTEGHYSKRFRLIEPKAIIQAFEDRTWKPLSSQLAVAWPNARLATRLDLVLHDTLQNEILIVEIKSGCGYRNLANGKMKHILPSITNSALNQHQLQVLIGKRLFQKTYPNHTLTTRCVLVYVSIDGHIDIIEESDFTVKYTESIENVIVRTR
jgi:hypothetical protein